MKKIIASIYLLSLGIISFAQGIYEPPNADYTYPRTIIAIEDLPTIQESLTSPEKKELYRIIWDNAHTDYPEDNLSYLERRKRAEIAREAAFVVIMNRAFNDGDIMTLSENDKIELQDKTIHLLNTLNPAVGIQEGWSFYWEWQLRSKELIHYLIAYDLLKGSGVDDELLTVAEEKLQNFAGNLYARAEQSYPAPISFFPDLDFYEYNPNNHGIMISSTLGLAAIVLNNTESDDPNLQPINWINAGMWNLDNTLWRAEEYLPRVAEPDIIAGYFEGPNYFQYGFQNAFPFIRAMWNFLPDGEYQFTYDGIERTIRHPWYDDNYHRLYEWMNLIRMPNGGSPSIHDSGANFGTTITALSGKSEFNIANPNYDYRNIWIRSQYIATNVDHGTFDKPLFQALPEAGSLIFRSAWDDSEAVYMHLIGKKGIALSGAKAHHQADATSFQIYYNGEILAYDEGYSGANYRDYVSKATDHNLILVNGQGPGVPIGEFVSPDNEVFIENFFDTKNIDYGELRATWQGADIVRKVLFLRDRYFIMTDFVKANTVNDYQYQLHVNGLLDNEANTNIGRLETDFPNHNILLTKNDSKLQGHFSARGGVSTYSVLNDTIYNGNSYKEHSNVLVHKNGVEATEFMTILYPYQEDANAEITEIEIDENVIANLIITEGVKDLIITRSDGELSSISDAQLPEELSVIGDVSLLSFDVQDKLESIFIENGNYLELGNELLFSADEKLDIKLQYEPDGAITGYLNKAGVIKLKTDSTMISDSPIIDYIEYDDVNQLSYIYFNAGGHFKLNYALVNNTPEIIKHNYAYHISPNPFNTSFNLSIDLPKAEMFRFALKTIDGKTLNQRQYILRKGVNNVSFDLESYPSGLYILEMKSPSHYEVSKLMKH